MNSQSLDGYNDNSMLYHVVMNTSAFRVPKSMKGTATVEELVVSKVTTVRCKITFLSYKDTFIREVP